MRGMVTGTKPGDSVEVWFEGGGQTSDSFTYQAVSETGNRVLVVAAEDYTGASPVQTAGPALRRHYLDALAANGIGADVYDVDARGRTAPGRRSACSATTTRVIWDTGDDVVTRTAGRAGGNADRLALDEMLEFRAYMNEGGRVLLHRQLTPASSSPAPPSAPSSTTRRARSPATRRPPASTRGAACRCAARPAAATDQRRAAVLVRRHTSQIASDGSTTTATAFDVNGIDDPFDGLVVGPRRRRQRGQPGPDVVVRRRPAASCRPTSSRSSRAGPSAR